MDYHSKDLKKILDKADKIIINNEHVIKVLYSLLCAIKFVHSANVLHRDIKPANLLFQKNCHVVLCDFGLARTLPKHKQMIVPTHRAQIAAHLEMDRKERQKRKRALSPHTVTRFYRPPEIILLDREYNCAVDIWSLGCVMIELLNCC